MSYSYDGIVNNSPALLRFFEVWNIFAPSLSLVTSGLTVLGLVRAYVAKRAKHRNGGARRGHPLNVIGAKLIHRAVIFLCASDFLFSLVWLILFLLTNYSDVIHKLDQCAKSETSTWRAAAEMHLCNITQYFVETIKVYLVIVSALWGLCVTLGIYVTVQRTTTTTTTTTTTAAVYSPHASPRKPGYGQNGSIDMVSAFQKKTRRVEFGFHLLSWGYPLLASIVFGVICGIYGIENLSMWIVWYFYQSVVLGVILLLAIVLRFIIWRRLRKVFAGIEKTLAHDMTIADKNRKREKQVLNRLSHYLIPFFICNVWMVIIWLHVAVELISTRGKFRYDTQTMWQVIRYGKLVFYPLQGFLNSLVYSLNTKLVRNALQRCYYWCKKPLGSGSDGSDSWQRNPLLLHHDDEAYPVLTSEGLGGNYSMSGSDSAYYKLEAVAGSNHGISKSSRGSRDNGGSYSSRTYGHLSLLGDATSINSDH